MLRILKIATLIFAMVIVLVVAAAVTLRLALHVGEVPVPNFSGLTVAEASDAALREGLDLSIGNRFYSTTVPAGRIISQSPTPGSEVRKSWQVRVAESLGPQQVAIPDVVGEPERQATMDLHRNQLEVGAQLRLDAPGEPDMVLAQTPPPNAGVDQPRVNLLLSSQGSDDATAVVVPSFVGMSYTTAAHEVNALGFRVSSVGGMPAAPAAQPSPSTQPGVAPLVPALPTPEAVPIPVTPAGPVLSQVPEAGYRGSRGATIRLYFVQRSAPAQPRPAITTVAVPTTP